MLRLSLSVIAAGAMIFLACSSEIKDSSPEVKRQAAGKTNDVEATIDPPVVDVESVKEKDVAGLPLNEAICQQGPVATQVTGQDFSRQFSFVCSDGKTNETFDQIISESYVPGSGQEPKVHLLASEVGELFVTNLVIAYAIKVPLSDPTSFASMNPFSSFAEGIRRKQSDLVITVESSETFPGNAVVQRQVLHYDLQRARNAGIFDQRRTEFNSYLLNEKSREVIIGSEHLLDVEQNPNYHLANGLLIGVKIDETHSVLLFLTELVVKNRIDPSRMETTIVDLNGGAAEILADYVSNYQGGE